jgi:hypothetical protein
MFSGFGLYFRAEKRAEGLTPVGARPHPLLDIVVVNLKGALQLQNRGGHMPARAGKGVRAVAMIADALLTQRDGQLGSIDLKILALNAAFGFPEKLFLFQGEFLHAAFLDQIAGGVNDVFRNRIFRKFLQDMFCQIFIHDDALY